MVEEALKPSRLQEQEHNPMALGSVAGKRFRGPSTYRMAWTT
jgi:hypothetical protein